VPYSDPNVHSQDLCASHDAPQKESQALLALDRIERIMERIEPASTASSMQLQAFIGQGELISFIFLYSLKFLKFSLLHCNPFHGVCRVFHSLLYNMERSWAAAGFPAACPELRLVPAARYSGAKMCDSKHCLVFA
jgi:hypothetical protein